MNIIQPVIRTPNDSYVIKRLALSTDPKLRELFANPLGEIRFGLLLEELDAMAGIAAYRHAVPEAIAFAEQGKGHYDPLTTAKLSLEIPLIIVTAACNRIELFGVLDIHTDLQIQGCVIWVGRSSMEVRVSVEAVSNGTLTPRIVSFFTMVARDPKTGQAAPVHGITPETEQEKRHFEEATARAQKRKYASQMSLTRVPPSDEEREIIHKLFLDTQKESNPLPPLTSFMENKTLPPDYVYISSTKYQSTIIMQPQKKNIHNKIFGGYLMRKAYELAWTIAYLFTGAVVSCKAVDDITFLSPVEIGNILTFTGEIVFTQDNSMMVSVAADVINPGLKMTTTNVFHFTFTSKKPMVKQIVPYSYEEAMRFIDGRRKMLQK